MPTIATCMGDGLVVHSCGDCEVDVPMGSRSIAHRFYVMDTEAFDFILGTNFFVEHSKILSLTLLWFDLGTVLFLNNPKIRQTYSAQDL